MKQQGFSLIEVIAVLILTSFVASMSFLSSHMMEQAVFISKVNEVVAGIEAVKGYAAATGRQYNFYCFSDRILLRQGINCIDKIYLVGEMEIPDEKMTGRWIRFKGTAAPSKAGTIIIIDRRLGKRARITVGVATGKVRVYYEALT